jgi:hypothetical protein
MWRTSSGERTLIGPEADLIRHSLASATDIVFHDPEDDDPWEFGVPVFDALPKRQRLAMLARVGSALLKPESPCPPLTALSEGTVAALYKNIAQQVELEIEMATDGDLEPSGDDPSWRELVIAAFPTQDMDEPITADCTDFGEWQIIVENGYPFDSSDH